MDNDIVKRLLWAGLLAGLGALASVATTQGGGDDLAPGLRGGPARVSDDLHTPTNAGPTAPAVTEPTPAVTEADADRGASDRHRRVRRAGDPAPARSGREAGGPGRRRVRRRARARLHPQATGPMTDRRPDPSPSSPQNIAQAVQDVSDRAQQLVREEIELAKAEVTKKVNKLAQGRRGRRGRRRSSPSSAS